MLTKRTPLPIPSEEGSRVGTRGDLQAVTTYHHPNLFQFKGLAHAVFTRHGGVSTPPCETLNVSYHTDDRRENVDANLRIIKEVMGARHLKAINQVHGKDIQILKSGHSVSPKRAEDADALISDMTNTGLLVKLADCQGVLLFDPARRVIANVHCGWRGNRLNILGSVVGRMKSDFGCEKGDIRAAIGPSLGPCCAEFIGHEDLFPDGFRHFMVRENYFDLWAISRMQLLESGLQRENIDIAGICTRCRTDLFYSYRAEKTTGRFATVIMLV